MPLVTREAPVHNQGISNDISGGYEKASLIRSRATVDEDLDCFMKAKFESQSEMRWTWLPWVY